PRCASLFPYTTALPIYLLGLGTVRRAEARAADAGVEPALRLAGIVDAFGARGADDRTFLLRAAASDARAWAAEFGIVRDVTGLAAERNAFRYRNVPVVVRAEAGANPVGLARVVLARLVSGAQFRTSSAVSFSPREEDALRAAGVELRIDDSDTWHATAASLRDARIRLVGGGAEHLLSALGGRPDI